MCVSIVHTVVAIRSGKVVIAAKGDADEREVSLALLGPDTEIHVGDGVRCRDGYVVEHLSGGALTVARELEAAVSAASTAAARLPNDPRSWTPRSE